MSNERKYYILAGDDDFIHPLENTVVRISKLDLLIIDENTELGKQIKKAQEEFQKGEDNE